ncbi:Malonate-semialdehyde dehydrogenase (acetylating) [Micromonospora noduli]|uniref:Malonate-semialdehyde dehydrogenase (Acetylating) n=1 Tax=Micromonospora noduli TaxID=709876 RepID=A0ABX9D7M7_9ACTN|nr:aldehyde dehydrogenase family protein [Micromonospora noduli]RAO24553.1 Malonate-semialdehyde dehydrogenase (acetylating) [Micromonospora noduli]RAO49654.1 Malonate-semialdehyde dehydrogenase (acetylating) [Micromonospora noduli]
MTPSTYTVAGHWIGGETVTGSADTLPVVNPATGEVVAETPAGTAADVDRAVAAARAAFPAWSATTPQHRADVLRRLGAGLAARTEEIAQAITAEMGSPIGMSRTAQVAFPAAVVESVAGLADDFAWTEEVGNSLIVREPIGVVGAITPWNFPLQQVVSKLAPALLAGNTMVFKPSENAPLTARILAEVAAEAGVPAGVFNVVYGTGATVGEAISAHPDIDMISFTGSTRAGQRISAVAAATVKRVALELGGKGANIILDDADLPAAVERGLMMAFSNGGQVCGAWPRMLVPASRQDEVVALAAEAAKQYTVGDPGDEATRIGPMASEAHRQKVVGYIERGIADGARLVFGGPQRPEGLTVGAYVQPTIFADVDPTSAIAQEEIFGPVLTIIPYADEEEAVAIANGTLYGLTSGVFGEPEHALAIARRLRVGQVDVNAGHWNPLAPFGGYKHSGNGREFGRFGLEEFLETKSIQR